MGVMETWNLEGTLPAIWSSPHHEQESLRAALVSRCPPRRSIVYGGVGAVLPSHPSVRHHSLPSAQRSFARKRGGTPPFPAESAAPPVLRRTLAPLDMNLCVSPCASTHVCCVHCVCVRVCMCPPRSRQRAQKGLLSRVGGFEVFPFSAFAQFIRPLWDMSTTLCAECG